MPRATACPWQAGCAWQQGPAQPRLRAPQRQPWSPFPCLRCALCCCRDSCPCRVLCHGHDLVHGPGGHQLHLHIRQQQLAVLRRVEDCEPKTSSRPAQHAASSP